VWLFILGGGIFYAGSGSNFPLSNRKLSSYSSKSTYNFNFINRFIDDQETLFSIFGDDFNIFGGF
jgi:hypothetical protein